MRAQAGPGRAGTPQRPQQQLHQLHQSRSRGQKRPKGTQFVVCERPAPWTEPVRSAQAVSLLSFSYVQSPRRQRQRYQARARIGRLVAGSPREYAPPASPGGRIPMYGRGRCAPCSLRTRSFGSVGRTFPPLLAPWPRWPAPPPLPLFPLPPRLHSPHARSGGDGPGAAPPRRRYCVLPPQSVPRHRPTRSRTSPPSAPGGALFS